MHNDLARLARDTADQVLASRALLERLAADKRSFDRELLAMRKTVIRLKLAMEINALPTDRPTYLPCQANPNNLAQSAQARQGA